VCNNSAFTAELKINQTGREFQLIVRVAQPVPSSMLQGTVSMPTSSDRVPSITVPILILPQAPLMVSPNIITLPPGPLRTVTQETVQLSNWGKKLLSITGANVDMPGATVQIQELQTGREFNLVLTFPAGFKLPLDRETSLTISAANLVAPLIRVPLRESPVAGGKIPPKSPTMTVPPFSPKL